MIGFAASPYGRWEREAQSKVRKSSSMLRPALSSGKSRVIYPKFEFKREKKSIRNYPKKSSCRLS
jgi:hypothetical protein